MISLLSFRDEMEKLAATRAAKEYKGAVQAGDSAKARRMGRAAFGTPHFGTAEGRRGGREMMRSSDVSMDMRGHGPRGKIPGAPPTEKARQINWSRTGGLRKATQEARAKAKETGGTKPTGKVRPIPGQKPAGPRLPVDMGNLPKLKAKTPAPTPSKFDAARATGAQSYEHTMTLKAPEQKASPRAAPPTPKKTSLGVGPSKTGRSGLPAPIPRPAAHAGAGAARAAPAVAHAPAPAAAANKAVGAAKKLRLGRLGKAGLIGAGALGAAGLGYAATRD